MTKKNLIYDLNQIFTLLIINWQRNDKNKKNVKDSEQNQN